MQIRNLEQRLETLSPLRTMEALLPGTGEVIEAEAGIPARNDYHSMANMVLSCCYVQIENKNKIGCTHKLGEQV